MFNTYTLSTRRRHARTHVYRCRWQAHNCRSSWNMSHSNTHARAVSNWVARLQCNTAACQHAVVVVGVSRRNTNMRRWRWECVCVCVSWATRWITSNFLKGAMSLFFLCVFGSTMKQRLHHQRAHKLKDERCKRRIFAKYFAGNKQPQAEQQQ